MNRDLKNLLVFFGCIFFAGMLMVISAKSKADYRRYDQPPTIITNNLEVESTSGAAATMSAAQLHFDWSTNKTQIGIGFGHYEGESALSIGIGQRFDEVLINGSFCGDRCVGAGATLRF